MEAAVLDTFGPAGVDGAFAIGLNRSFSCFYSLGVGSISSTYSVCRSVLGPETQTHAETIDEFGPSLQSSVLAPLSLALLRGSGALFIRLQHGILVLGCNDDAGQDRNGSLLLELETGLMSEELCDRRDTYHCLSERNAQLLGHFCNSFICWSGSARDVSLTWKVNSASRKHSRRVQVNVPVRVLRNDTLLISSEQHVRLTFSIGGGT